MCRRGLSRTPCSLFSRRNSPTSAAPMYLYELRRSPYEQHVVRIYGARRVLSHACITDVCQTSIFSGSWICRKCGKEVCSDCYATITTCRYEDPNMFARGARRVDGIERNRHYCTIRQAHFASDFLPVSRFDNIQLEYETKAMEILLGSSPSADAWKPETPHVAESFPLTISRPPIACEPRLSHKLSSSQCLIFPISQTNNSRLTDYFVYSRVEPSGIPSRDMHGFHGPHITEDDFQIVWATGEPLCVDGLLSCFKIAWEPSYFIEKFGHQECFLVDCEHETQTLSTVAGFFSQFGNPRRDPKVEKLKATTPSCLTLCRD